MYLFNSEGICGKNYGWVESFFQFFFLDLKLCYLLYGECILVFRMVEQDICDKMG